MALLVVSSDTDIAMVIWMDPLELEYLVVDRRYTVKKKKTCDVQLLRLINLGTLRMKICAQETTSLCYKPCSSIMTR